MLRKAIGVLPVLAGLALASQAVSAGEIVAVLQGPGTTSSGSAAHLDLSSSYFDFTAPVSSSNTSGTIDQYRFDFGDGSASTSWSPTSFVSHVYVGLPGQPFVASGFARWSGDIFGFSADSLIIKIAGEPGPAPAGAPVAVFGGSQFYDVNVAMALDASSSYDPDGDTNLIYQWDLHDNSAFTVDATGAQTSITYAQPGIHIVGLRVCDASNCSTPVYTEVGRLADFGLPLDWPYATPYAPTAPVPEPETYGMLMAGLGLLGFIGRRKKQQTA